MAGIMGFRIDSNELISGRSVFCPAGQKAEYPSYCPTPDHLLLLLTLLSVEDRASGKDPQNLGYRPGLVILCDLARLFMEAVEGHENLPPEEMEGVKEEGEMRLKHE